MKVHYTGGLAYRLKSGTRIRVYPSWPACFTIRHPWRVAFAGSREKGKVTCGHCRRALRLAGRSRAR